MPAKKPPANPYQGAYKKQAAAATPATKRAATNAYARNMATMPKRAPKK